MGCKSKLENPEEEPQPRHESEAEMQFEKASQA